MNLSHVGRTWVKWLVRGQLFRQLFLCETFNCRKIVCIYDTKINRHWIRCVVFWNNHWFQAHQQYAANKGSTNFIVQKFNETRNCVQVRTEFESSGYAWWSSLETSMSVECWLTPATRVQVPTWPDGFFNDVPWKNNAINLIEFEQRFPDRTPPIKKSWLNISSCEKI